MTQPSQTSTTIIAFHGVQLAFPATLPFSHQDGCLVLDFSLGYTGKLVIKPGAIKYGYNVLCSHHSPVSAAAVSGSLAAASPTLHVAQTNQQPQHQGLVTCHPSFSGHLSQHNDLSQGSYPPWMLQSSIPALCIPDSVGTQSPFQKDRQTHLSQDQPAAVILQQQEAHKRNAAALQELMTQADASEPDADDFVADTAADADAEAADKAAASTPSRHDVPQTNDTGAAIPTADHTSSLADAAQAAQIEQAAVPAGPAMHQDKAETGRGAGTPAGPQEEFYSPQEHFHSEPAEQPDSILSDVSIPRMKDAKDNAQQAAGPLKAKQAAEAGITQHHPDIAEEDEHPPKDALAAKRRQLAQKAEGKTPLQTKTPANPKRRKGNKR